MPEGFTDQPEIESSTIDPPEGLDRRLRAYGNDVKNLHRWQERRDFLAHASPLGSETSARERQISPWGDQPPSLLAAHLPRATDIERPAVPRITRSRIVRRYVGVVQEIHEDIFSAILSQAPEHDDLVAEFVVDEVSDDDRELLKPGAWFYVSVEKQTWPDGRSSTLSSLRFRRLRRWTEEEIAIARERGLKMAQLLAPEDAQ